MILEALAVAYGLSPQPQISREVRLASFLCELQPALRFGRGKQWDEKTCQEVAAAFVKQGQTLHRGTKVHDLLGLAVAIQESDLVATAIRELASVRGLPKSHDSGLMAIHHPSDFTRGLKAIDVLRIGTNIRLGFEILGYYKTTVLRRTVVHGEVVTSVPDDHETFKDHFFWRHYQNGSTVITKGWQASYDLRVAAIYTALCDRLGEKPYELHGREIHRRQDSRTQGLVRIIGTVKWADPSSTTRIVLN